MPAAGHNKQQQFTGSLTSSYSSFNTGRTQSPGCVTCSVSISRSFYKYKQLFEVNHLDRALVSNPCSLAPVS